MKAQNPPLIRAKETTYETNDGRRIETAAIGTAATTTGNVPVTENA